MKLFVILMSLGVWSSAHAAVPASCTDKYEIFDGTQVQMQPSSSSCLLSVHPRDSYVNLVYRDFLFDSDGLFMVFNSFGQGDESKMTAAREYSFFPRRNGDMSYTYDKTSKKLFVTAPSGKVFTFETVHASLVDIAGTRIVQHAEVNAQNGGGIDVVGNDGLMMDGGFTIGKSPAEDPENKVTFKDAQGHSCQLVNADIYNYTTDGDNSLKYDDAQLKSFLGKHCPNLQY